MTSHPAHTFLLQSAASEKMHIHCQAVVNCCVGAVEGTNLNADVFIIAGWLHDLGKLIDDDSHHLASITFLNSFLEAYPEYLPLQPEISDCIIHHRTGGKPETVYGDLFKVADKVALHNSEWLAFKNAERRPTL